jgi:phage shock protein E
MKRAILVMGVMMLAALVLGACAGSTAPTPAVQASDVSNLPDNVSISQTKALLGRSDVMILDVREQEEYDQGHIPGVTLIPSGQIANRLSEIPKDKPVIVTCRSGNRSATATQYLREQGYTNVHNMEGGIVAWQGAGYPVEK